MSWRGNVYVVTLKVTLAYWSADSENFELINRVDVVWNVEFW